MFTLTLWALLSTICYAYARPSLIIGPATLVGPAAPGVLLQGPSAETTILGPDGSIITATAKGGAVVAAPKPGGVVTAAVVPGYVAAAPALAAPILGAPALLAPALATSTSAILASSSASIINPGIGAPLIVGPSKLLVAGCLGYGCPY